MKRLISRTLLALALFATPALAADFDVDPAHSFVTFKAQHLGAGFTHGRFNKMKGNLSFDEANIEQSKFTLTIDAASVDTGIAKRDDHLRSPDFFNVKQFPEVTFESTAWKKVADKKYEVTGKLTLHGTTKEITVPVVLVGQGKGFKGESLVGIEATFSIDRMDYGVAWNPDVVSKKIDMVVSIEGIAK